MKPWQRKMWCIPPEHDAEFVCAMEGVLDVYTRSYDAARPVVCLDEKSKQLVAETRAPIPARRGEPERWLALDLLPAAIRLLALRDRSHSSREPLLSSP